MLNQQFENLMNYPKEKWELVSDSKVSVDKALDGLTKEERKKILKQMHTFGIFLKNLPPKYNRPGRPRKIT